MVILGNNITHTDRNGVFTFRNITVDKSNIYIKVKKDGYFESYKSFSGLNHSVNNVKFILSQRYSYNTYPSNQPNTILIGNNNSTVTFSADAFSYLDGTPYNGNICILFKSRRPQLL